MSALVRRAAWRHFRRHPWQLILTVLGVALGVAVVVAVDLANAAAARAFELSRESVVGHATHEIIGGPSGLDERVYAKLRDNLGLQRAAPVVEGYGKVGNETLHLLGVDPLAETGVRGYLARLDRTAAVRLLTEPNTVALADVTATRLGLRAGERFPLALGARTARVTLVAVLATDATTRARLDGLLFADISTAQELLDYVGRLSWIDLVLPPGAAGERLSQQIEARLPRSAALVPAAARGNTIAQMTHAFRVNLTAMSLLALLVGMFLIYNTMTFAVLQRRLLLGQLRALGMTRAGVFALVLREGLIVGVLGTVFGLIGGVALGHGLVGLVARTINDLYFAVSVTTLPLAPVPLIKGAVLGVFATIASVLLPAREAAFTPPGFTLVRSVLEARAHVAAPRLALAGIGLMLTAALILSGPGRSLVPAFIALFLALIGMTLLAPLLVHLGTRLSHRAAGHWLSPTARLALRGIDAALSRTGVAIAALLLAVATTVGVGVMIASFRASVAEWLDTTLRADIYVTAPSLKSTRTPAQLEPAYVARVRALPDVDEVSSVRRVTVESRAGLDELAAFAIPPSYAARFTFLAGDRRTALPDFFAGRAVLVTEPYAYRHDIKPGDEVSLRTDRGPHAFLVAGVVRDYGTEQGEIVMIRSLYEAYFDDPYVSSLGIRLAPGADLDAAMVRIRAAAGSHEAALVRSNRELRAGSLAVFDRTFTITSVLRLLAVSAAIIGILSALMALALERAREFGVLRALGFTPAGIRALVMFQTGVMGLAAGVLALPVGTALALLLIHVINRRAFGWSMQTLLPGPVYLEALALALLAALLAGIYPAWRLARATPSESLREE